MHTEPTLDYAKVNEYLYWGSSPIDDYWRAKYNLSDEVFTRQLSSDVRLLTECLGIKNLINIKYAGPPAALGASLKAILWLPVPDGYPPTVEQLLTAIAFIRTAMSNREPCYVHCRYGLGRSTTLIVGYLIETGMSYQAAVDLVTQLRPPIVEGFTLKQQAFLQRFAQGICR